MSRFKKEVIFNVIAPFATEVEAGAFDNFIHLRYVYSPMLEIIGRAGFYYCLALFRVDGQIKIVGDTGFNVCLGLAKIDLSQLENIGQGAFRMCDSLQQLVNKKLTEINLMSLESCKTMRLLDLENVSQTTNSVHFNQQILVRLPKCNKFNIGSDKQVICSQDTQSVIVREKYEKDVVQQILVYRASQCNLAQIQSTLQLQQDFHIRGLVTNVKIIPENVFSSSYFLFVEAHRLEKIEKNAFSSSYCLRRFISNKLQIIEESGFRGCVSLSEITVQNVVELQRGAFSYCQSLVKLDFHKLKEFNEQCFQECSSLLQIIGCFPQSSKFKEIEILVQGQPRKRFQEFLVDEFHERKEFMQRCQQIKSKSRILKGIDIFFAKKKE